MYESDFSQASIEVETPIDTEVLIREIHSREVLWKISSEDYKDRYKKEEAWQEIYIALNDDYSSLSASKKKLFGKCCIEIYIYISMELYPL